MKHGQKRGTCLEVDPKSYELYVTKCAFSANTTRYTEITLVRYLNSQTEHSGLPILGCPASGALCILVTDVDNFLEAAV